VAEITRQLHYTICGVPRLHHRHGRLLRRMICSGLPGYCAYSPCRAAGSNGSSGSLRTACCLMKTARSHCYAAASRLKNLSDIRFPTYLSIRYWKPCW
jgi:hypothetical protein